MNRKKREREVYELGRESVIELFRSVMLLPQDTPGEEVTLMAMDNARKARRLEALEEAAKDLGINRDEVLAYLEVGAKHIDYPTRYEVND